MSNQLDKMTVIKKYIVDMYLNGPLMKVSSIFKTKFRLEDRCLHFFLARVTIKPHISACVIYHVVNSVHCSLVRSVDKQLNLTTTVP